MAQVTPLTASDEVTVVVFPSKNDDKLELVEQQSTSLKQKIIVGILYTVVSTGFLYGCVAAVTFFGDVFTLLLVLTRN